MNGTGATRREFLALAAGAAISAAAAKAQTGSPPGRVPIEPNASAFDEVWELVRDRFYDPRLHGLDWSALRDRCRPQAEQAQTRDELALAVNALLQTLNASHTRYYTSDEPAYYQLADIFSGALQRRGLQRVFPGGEVTYPGIGIFDRNR